MRFLALVIHAIRVTLSQKITIGILVAFTILLFIIIFTVRINAADGAVKSISIYGSKPIDGADFSYILPKFAEVYASMYFLVAMVLSVIATAQIIPEAISNRTFILYISKPISRRSIIMAIFTGVTVAIVLAQLIFVLSIWIIFTVKTGITNWDILMSIVPIAVAFSALYALMVYVGIVGKSTGMVTGLAMGHVLLISHLLSSQDGYLGSALVTTFGHIFRNIARIFLPGVHELQEITLSIIMSRPADINILLISLLPCLLYLWLSVRAFQRMDL